jgi:class 3 adenylate cyclase
MASSDRIDALREVTRGVNERTARQNELRLAQIRIVIIAGSLIVNLAAWRWPSAVGLDRFDAVMVQIAAGCLGLALLELAALRAVRFSPWLPWVIAVGDVGFVFAFAAGLDASGLIPVLDYSGEACIVLALSGAARGTVRAAMWTTTLATLTMVGSGLMIGIHPLALVLRGTLVIGAGFLGVWLSGLVQRARERDLGEAILPRFLPHDIVERLHQDPDALVAAARTVHASIVFVDLRGFTALAEARSPGEAFALLNRLHARLAEIIDAEHGHVDKFLGDGLLAVFGAHGDHADHADRAIRAGLRIAELAPDADDGALELGVGIHTGDVLAGAVGGDRRLEFTVIGDAVNTASRIEQATKQHATRMLVSADTLRAVSDPTLAARFEPLGAIAVRGRKAPVDLYRLA